MESVVVSGAALIFFALSRGLAGKLAAGREWFEGMKSHHRELWLNSAASFCHALVSGAVALVLLSTSPQVIDNPLETDNQGTRILVAISNGYFLYDLIDIFKHRLFMKGAQWLVYAHHVVVIFCFSTALWEGQLTAYLALNLVCEVNNWFLHGGKVFRRMGVEQSGLLCKLNDVLFLASALLFRMAPHLWIQFKLWEDRPKFVNTSHFALAFSGMVAINLLNVMLVRDFFISRYHMYKPRAKSQ